MRQKICSAAVICYLLFSGPLLAAEDPSAASGASISVKSELDRASITIGEPVQYSVTTKHGPSIQILSSIPAPSSDIFKIKKIEDIREVDGDGTILEGKKFTLTTFRLGEYILDAVKIEYREKGADIQSIETNRLFLKVKSVMGDEEQTDIRAIKSVLSIPKNLWLPLGAGLGILLLIAALLIIKRLRKGPAIEAPAERVLSAEEDALLHLTQLFESDLLGRGRIKEYYLKYSEVLRIYLERRFKIQAVESTTQEIQRYLKEELADKSLRSLINEVLEFSDLAKFAKLKPEVQEINEMNHKAREIIELAKPREADMTDGI